MSSRRNKRIIVNEDPKEAPPPSDFPADGARMDVKCTSTRFLNKGFRQMGPHKASICASVECGIFSIRDKNTNTMLTVTLQDAMYVISETLSMAKELENTADGVAEGAAVND